MTRFRARSQVIAVLLVAGCEAPTATDSMTPSVVAELGKQRGAGSGLQTGGTYVIDVTAMQCGCADVALDLLPLTLCGALLAAVQPEGRVVMDIVEADGHLAVGIGSAPTPSLVGPIAADASFAAGSLTELVALGNASGTVVTRIDGKFNAGSLSDAITFDADLRHRMVGAAALEELDLDFDCLDEVTVTGTRD